MLASEDLPFTQQHHTGSLLRTEGIVRMGRWGAKMRVKCYLAKNHTVM